MTLDGLRVSLGLLTIAPVPGPRPDRRVAGRAIAWAPAVGAMLGLVAAGLLVLAERVANLGPLLSATLAVATLALLTRGLHLDGLADVADGLGSGRWSDAALRVMKNSDIGPFGVVTLVLVVIVQVAALARATALGNGPIAIVVAAVTGRLAVTWACRRGVPAARPEGLGALVAGTVRVPVAAALTAGGLAAAAPFGAAPALAVVVGLLAAAALQHHAVRRFGGITGDVLGALVEIATTGALLVMAVGIG